jgi:GT2 family glycosyltransferase
VLLDGRFNKEAFGREILQPSNTGATSDLVAQLLESCDPVLAEQLGESDTPEEQRTVLKGQLQAFVEGASAGLAMASGRRWPTSMLASARVRVGLVHGDPEDPAVVALAAALATLGFDVARLHANGLEREVDDLDLVHVLIEGESADVLSQVPCLVPGTDGWRMHLFGLQAAPHGAHARPELCIPVTANPLDESPRVAAARWAFRYRQLICMSKAREAYERWGFEADHRSGEVRREGEVLATLGPGPARIEFDLPPMGSDVSELLLEVEFVESDLGATRCAIVSLDGKEIALAGALKVSAAPSVATSRVAVQVPTTGGRLAISNRTPSGSLSICRVRGLRLRRSPRGPRDEFLAVSPVPSQPMAEPAKVAVIIVTLAGVPRLEGCLKALGASHYPAERLEVCVVDNGNSAETRQWLQANHPAVRLLVPGTNIGFTQGANLGLTEVADCPVTVFLNDDAEVSADFIGELIQPVLAGTCSAAAARMILPDGTPEYFGGAGSFQGLAFGGPEDAVRARDLDHARKTLFACGGAMAIDTEIFRAVGGFDEDYFAYYDDIDLGWRLWILGYEVHYVPTAVCTHARSSTSSTFPPESIRLLQVRNALCTCIKNLGDDALRATLPALLALAARRLWIQAERPYVGKLRIELLQPMPVRDALRRLLGTRFGITRMAMADLAGMQDVLGDWDKWMAKRERIQSSRKRLDADVLPLFLDPLRCVEGEAEYEALQSSLVRLFDLERVFGAS